MAYPTRADVVAGSSQDELTSLDAAQQDALYDAAIQAIEEFTGQRFAPEVKTVVVDGNGKQELFLPERLEELTAVALGGHLIGLDDVALDVDGTRLYWSSYVGSGYAAIPWGDSRTFRSGFGNIALTGTWGWTEAPAAIETALRYDMEEQAAADASGLAGSVAAYRRLGLRSAAQGNLRVDLADAPTGLSARAQRVLAPYVWHGGAGYIV
jgi:hypothetical protein